MWPFKKKKFAILKYMDKSLKFWTELDLNSLWARVYQKEISDLLDSNIKFYEDLANQLGVEVK
jgi:hypothetical protein